MNTSQFNQRRCRKLLVIHVTVETAGVLDIATQRQAAGHVHALLLQDVSHGGVVGEHIRRARAEAHVAREPEVELRHLGGESLAVEGRLDHEE